MRAVDEAIEERDAALAASMQELNGARAQAADRAAEIRALADELVASQSRIQHLEAVATKLSELVVERERELRAVRQELADLRAEGERGVESVAALVEELEGVRRQARGQATRIRLNALREAAELSDRVAEIAKRPGETRERFIGALQDAIERIGAAPELDGDQGESVAASNGSEPRTAAELFDGLVEVEIGPLADFSQLVGFEDAAGGIAQTREISVKRFSQGRATLEMRLGEPVELLRELEDRAPFEFRVRDSRSGRLVLDVDSE